MVGTLDIPISDIQGRISSTNSQAWQRRKLLGGYCECFEKQAFGVVIIDIETQNLDKQYCQDTSKEGLAAQALKPGEGESS
ncbi:unnamed protein product, partial [Vitis vinifera]